MEVDFAVGGHAATATSARSKSASQAVGLSKQRRAQVADGQREIDVVENISRRHAERQIVAVIGAAGIGSPAATSSAAKATTASASPARSTRAAAKSSALHRDRPGS